MDFFNTLSEINKNKDNFKKWEEEQKNETVQREELHKRRKHRQAEIAQAKAFGEKIIDVVDIMDNHSESVAENVETATEPIVAIAPFASLGLSTWASAKYIFKPNYEKRSELRDTIYKENNGKELQNKINEINKKVDKWGFVTYEGGYREYDFFDESNIKKIKNSELQQKAREILKEFEKQAAPTYRKDKLGYVGMAASFLLSFVGINIFAAKLSVDSSKIARFQAREYLKDPKTFVIYTPEQIEQAKEEIKKHPEWKKKEIEEGLETGFFSSIKNLVKDRKAYSESVKNDKDESKKVTRTLTKDEIENAKKDKEVIQRTVRIINNEAEKYSQRMEVAGDVIMGGTPVLGAIVGGAVSWVCNKFGIIEKYVDNYVSKNASDETKKRYESLKKGKESGKSTWKKWQKFTKSFMRDLGPKERGLADFAKRVKRLGISSLTTGTGRNIVLAGAGAVVTGFVGMIIGLQLQKSAARAGRYTAKTEMEKDPKNFIGYTEEDYNEVKDIKSDKKSSDVKEILMFVPTAVKQYLAYKDYRNNEFKENQLLQKQLEKQEVSEEQLKDAKNLQRKVFNTFEKVDDNSQTYSETTEAAIDIAQPMVFYGGMLALISPAIFAGVQIYRGKITGASALNKVLGFLSASSERLKSKRFTTYLDNVGNNISRRVQNTEIEAKPAGTLLENVNLQEDSIVQIMIKSSKNIEKLQKDFANMSNDEQCKMLYQIEHELERFISFKNLFKDEELEEQLISKFGIKRETNIEKIRMKLISLQFNTDNPQVRADLFEIIINPAHKLQPERVKAAEALAEKCGIDLNKLEDIGNNIQFFKQAENNSVMLEEMEKDVQNFIASKEKKQSESEITIDWAKERLDEVFGHSRTKQAGSAKLKDMKQVLPEFLRDPKKLVEKLKKDVKSQTDEEFNAQMERIGLSSMTKKMMEEEIIPKLEKMADNIPQEEIEKILEKALKEFNEHPDEFIRLLSSGNIYKIFITPGVEKAMAAGLISWTTLNLAVTYMISSYLGEVQLEAGRLGVMKAIEDLNDYRYYANVEPSKKEHSVIVAKKSKPANLLQK